MKPSALGFCWMTKWCFLRGVWICQSKHIGAWRSPSSKELRVQLFGGCLQWQRRDYSLSALFKRMYMGQQWKPDKLVLWRVFSRQPRSKYGAAGRLASSRSYRPSWMLFHPFQWLIQNQLSHPSGPIAGCKLASLWVQIKTETVCAQRPEP